MAFIRQRGKKRLWTLVDEARNYYEPLKTDNEKLANLALKQYESEQFLASQGLQMPGQKKSANNPTGKTFASLKDDFLSNRKSTLKNATYTKEQYVLGKFQEIIQPDKISDIDNKCALKWQDTRLNSIATYRGEPRKKLRIIKPITVRAERTILYTFFKYLLSGGYIDKNPFDSISKIKPPKRLPRALNENDQMRVLIEYKKESELRGNPLLFMAALIMLTCSRRVSEVGHIFWENVDPKGKWFKLCSMPCACNDCKKNKSIYSSKNKKDIMVNVTDPELSSLLVKYRQPHGSIMNVSKSGLAKVTRRVFNRAGIAEAGKLNHSLRHSGAMNQLKAGTHIKAIQQMLGHESLSSTMIYTELSDENLAVELKKFKRPSLPSSE